MFILYITSRCSHFNILFSKPCQRQCELLPSLGVRYYQKLSAQSKQIKTRGSEDFLKSANQKQELPVVAMFGNGS
jgi:hypothetical protein